MTSSNGLKSVVSDYGECKHQRRLRSDLGFILCKDCDVILDTPTISDLAYAELKCQ